MNRHIMEDLAAAAASDSGGMDSLPGKIWRRIKSKIDALGEKPEAAAAREKSESGDR
jgi:hypothetical protein